MINQVEDFVNSLTDMDLMWFPVLFLRPAKNKDIDNVVLFKLSLVFDALIVAIIVVQNISSKVTTTISDISITIVWSWLLYFVLYKCTFAYFWNRRARRLREE